MCKNDIGKRLALYFFAVILIFALLISATFAGLFRKQVIETNKDDLEKKALAVSATLSEYISTPKGWDAISNFSAYLKVLSDVNTADVWIIDDALQIYTVGNNSIKFEDLSKSANQIVIEAMSGKTMVSENFTDILRKPSISVATPIYKGNYITGVMLMHSPISGLSKMASMGMRVILICGVGAFIISIFPAVLLSKSFTDPILLKEAQENLRLEKLRRDYVANISHELKTPVTVLRGSLEALVDGVVTEDSEIKEYHEQMLHETVYLQRLVMDLLDLSRLQNTEFQIDHQKISLVEVIEDAVRSGEKLASSKNITISKEFSSPKMEYMGDFGRLRQMFIIILDNAIKFSPENSTISLSFSGNEIRIKDEGCGIAPEVLPHIFDRFCKSGGEQNKTGSGLGLAIAREIAYRHGIKISAKSQIDVGTEFIFEF